MLVIVAGALGWLVGATPRARGDATLEVAGGVAAGRLSAEARARMARLPRQDLLDKSEGRYTLMTDDGVSGHWGLDAIKARCEVGPKPYDKLRGPDGVYQTERIVFADTGTGATLMLLGQIPYAKDAEADELNYFGKSCWNADGSRMVWSRSAKPSLWGPGAQRTTEAFGPLVVRGNGTAPRIAFGQDLTMRAPVCSPTRPDASYSVVIGRPSRVVELSFRQDGIARTIGEVSSLWWLKLSPDDQYLMGKQKTGFWVLRIADGTRWDVTLDEAKTGACYPVHDSYRFVPADTDWIMYWYERNHPGGGLNKEGFRLRNFKTGEERIVGFRFDWNHGDVGRFLGYHCTPYVNRWNGTTFEPNQPLAWPTKTWADSGPYYSVPHDVGGYAVHWPDDQLWAYSCVYQRRRPEYLSEVSKVFAKPLPDGGRVNRFRVCYNNMWGGTDRWGNPSISLMRPNISPDGTKLLFSSNVFSRAGAVMVVCAKPLPPTDVTAKHRGCDMGVAVSWKPPKYRAEIAGYRVYRSDASGRGYRLITPEPVSGTEFVDTQGDVRAAHFYAVRSVEHSGLESPLSGEAPCGPLDAERLSVFCEAERAISAELDAPSPDAMWVNFDGFASNLHYIWQRRPDKPGRATLEAKVPRHGDYYVVARIKGKNGAAFTIAGREVTAPASAEWRWVRAAEPVRLNGGRQAVEIASSTHGSCLDCFYLTEDKDFDPTGRIIAERPRPLKLTAAPDGQHVRLSWSGSKSSRWYHYNLYASDRADAPAGQAALIASPDGQTYLDWQAEPGQTLYYRVTQVTLDGLESEPSDPVSAIATE